MQPFDPSRQPSAGAPLLPFAAPQGKDPGPGGLDFPPGLPLPAGTLLAQRFEVVERLAEGYGGDVYRVRDRHAGQAVRVLKTLDPRRCQAKDAERFRREARLLMRLDHPRIPKGYDMCDHRGMWCASMAYVEGEDLLARVRHRGPMPEREALGVMRQVLETLVYLHGQRPPVLHRDLKPENLIRDRSGAIHLIDFGSASDREHDKQDASLEAMTTMHTLGYAAPEQALGLEAYPASDLYGLGATVLYLLTGKNPVLLYRGHDARLAWEVALSPGLDALLEDMVAVPVRARLQSAQEALDRLASFAI